MSIELKFTASTFDDLLSQIRAFGKGTPERVELEGPVREAKSQKRAPKAPIAVEKPIEELFEEQEAVRAENLDAKHLLELKARMLTTLQAAIAEGKIDQLRALLAAEGGGAKSFPEVGVEFFPAIEKAVQNGALK